MMMKTFSVLLLVVVVVVVVVSCPPVIVHPFLQRVLPFGHQYEGFSGNHVMGNASNALYIVRKGW